MDTSQPTPEHWLASEDGGCREARAERLSWLVAASPPAELWLFPGGWLTKQQFEEARYCFVYGQFVASMLVGFAYVERTLAAMFYGAGRNDLQRAMGNELIQEAERVGWLSTGDVAAFQSARALRNPLTHFRTPLHAELPDVRAFQEDRDPYELAESDAKHVLQVVLRLVAINAVA